MAYNELIKNVDSLMADINDSMDFSHKIVDLIELLMERISSLEKEIEYLKKETRNEDSVSKMIKELGIRQKVF